MNKFRGDTGRVTKRNSCELHIFARSGSQAVCAGVLLFVSTISYAQPIEWIGSDGNWSDPTNWSTGNIPDMPSEMPILGGQSIYRVEMDFGYQFGSLSLTNPFAQLDILAGTRPNIAGDLLNNGFILVNSGGANGYASLDLMRDAVISGTGTIRLNANDETGGASIAGPYFDLRTLTNGPDHTIAGAGYISGPIINQGTIVADGPAGSELVFGSNDMEPNIITQSDTGLIYAQSGNIRFAGWSETTIIGGTVKADPPARLIPGGPLHLRNVHNQATIELNPDQWAASQLIFDGEITNDASIRIASGWAFRPRITIPSDTTILGTGEIVLGEGVEYENDIVIQGNSTVTNGPNHTIRGQGRITLDDESVFINNGTIMADNDYVGLILTGTFLGAGSYIARDEIRINFDSGPDGIARLEGGTLDAPGYGHISGIAIGSGYQITNITNKGFTSIVSTSLGGTILNTGTLELHNANTTHSDTVFSGSGIVYLKYSDSSFAPAPGKTITNETGHTFSVNGTLSGPFINRGTVTGAGTVQGPCINNGQIRATVSWNPLTLTGDFTQGSGTYDGGHERLLLLGCDLDHATLRSEPDGQVLFSDSHFESVTNNGVLESSSQFVSTFSGSFTNNNILRIRGQHNQSIRFTDTITIEGAGTIELIGARTHSQPKIIANPGQVITLNPDLTVFGNGQLLGTFVNYGLLQTQNILPYPLITALIVDDMTLASSSRVELDVLALYTDTEHLEIINNGTLTLGGTLDVRFAQGFEPDFGQWVLIDGQEGTEIIGDFDQINLPTAPANKRLRLTRTLNQLTLSLSCPTDFNGDFRFNYFDVAAFIMAFNEQRPDGDYNLDGAINFADISAFLSDFGTCP